MPTLSNKEYAILTARELVTTLQNMKKNRMLKIKKSHKEKLLDLARIFNDALPENDRQTHPEPDYVTPPRVKSKEAPIVKENNIFDQPTMSAQPSSPDVLQNNHLTHQ